MSLKIDVNIFNKDSQLLNSYSINKEQFFIDCENINILEHELYRVYKINEDYLLIHTINDLIPTININVIEKYPELVNDYDTSEFYTIPYFKDLIKKEKLSSFKHFNSIVFKELNGKLDVYSIDTDESPYTLYVGLDSEISPSHFILYKTLGEDKTSWINLRPIQDIQEYNFLIKCLKGVVTGYYNKDETYYARSFFEKLSKL